MSVLEIPRSLNSQFNVPCIGPITVDIQKAVASRVPQDGNVTNAIALKIFNSIKLESQILSFLSTPIGLFSVGALIASTGIFICTIASVFTFPIIAIIVGIAASTIGGFGIGFFGTMAVCGDKLFPHLTAAYDRQSALASEYITKIRQASFEGKEVAIEFIDGVATGL